MTGVPMLNADGVPALVGGEPAYDNSPGCECCCEVVCSGTYTLDASSLPANLCFGGGCTYPNPVPLTTPAVIADWCWSGQSTPTCGLFVMGGLCISNDDQMPGEDPCVLYGGAPLSLSNHPAYPFILWTVELQPDNDGSCGGGVQNADFLKAGGTTPVGTYYGNMSGTCYTVTVA